MIHGTLAQAIGVSIDIVSIAAAVSIAIVSIAIVSIAIVSTTIARAASTAIKRSFLPLAPL